MPWGTLKNSTVGQFKKPKAPPGEWWWGRALDGVHLPASLGISLDTCRQTFIRNYQGLTDRGHTVFTAFERAAHRSRYDLAPRL
ncbi:MAG TPA: hypothetical protein VH164_06140, partial [Ktedonobacteraceae bacterium]|nr:hypothetical protein [Ktedonobacteraceae bacterium]